MLNYKETAMVLPKTAIISRSIFFDNFHRKLAVFGDGAFSLQIGIIPHLSNCHTKSYFWNSFLRLSSFVFWFHKWYICPSLYKIKRKRFFSHIFIGLSKYFTRNVKTRNLFIVSFYYLKMWARNYLKKEPSRNIIRSLHPPPLTRFLKKNLIFIM